MLRFIQWYGTDLVRTAAASGDHEQRNIMPTRRPRLLFPLAHALPSIIISSMRAQRVGRILLAVTALLLAASIAFNYYLFSLSRRYYQLFNQTRLNPLGLDAFSDSAEEAEWQNSGAVKVVFFGDSRAVEWPLPQVNGFAFLNRGINSQTSKQLLLRYDAHIRNLNPDILVVQACINDLHTLPLSADSGAQVIAGCKRNLQEIVRRARAQGTAVILSTIFPVGQAPLGSRLFWSEEIPPAIEEVNAFMRSLEGEGVVIFDAYAMLADDQGRLPANYQRDELHLNDAGYAVLNQALGELLASGLE